MKRRYLNVMLLVFMLVFFVVPAPLVQADIPRYINYQGKLTDADDNPVTGDVSITLRIYSVETGGTAVWTETQTVTVTRGIFSMLLGSTTVLDELDFNDAYWYSVEVESDGEMTPRQRLTTVAYAINADKLDGYDASQFLRSDADTELSGNLTVTGGVITAGANEDITIDPTGLGNIVMTIDSTSGDFKITDGTTNWVLVDNATGNVTISQNLTVTGNITLDGNISDTSGAVTIGDALTQTGSTNQVTFAGNVDANNGLDVTGNLTVSGTTTLSGALDMNSNIDLDYSGTSAALDVNQQSTGPAAQFSGQRVVIGASEAANANALSAGELYVQGDLEVDGTIYGSISVSEGTATLSSLTVTGASDLQGNLDVGGNADITGNLDVAGDLGITGRASSAATSIAGAELTSGGTDDYTLNITQTLNDTEAAGGSDVYRGIKLNVTETDVTGWDNVYLMDLQVGDTSKFNVDDSGNLVIAGTLNMSSNKITNLADPTVAQDAATKAYADSLTPPEAGGWRYVDTSIVLVTSTDNVGIGTTSTDTYKLNVSGSTNTTSLYIGGSEVTASATELNLIDGYTGSTANLNTLTGGSNADSLHTHAVGSLTGNVISSIDGVTNDGGDVDLIAGSNITITPSDAANTITIASAASGDETGTGNLTFTIDSDNAGSEVATGAGIILEGGTGTNVSLLYNATTNDFDIAGITGGLDIPSATVYKINGSQITSGALSDVASIAMLDEAETIGANWVNTTYPWADDEVANALTISGGTIDNSVIGGTTAEAGTFTTLKATTLLDVDNDLDIDFSAATEEMTVDSAFDISSLQDYDDIKLTRTITDSASSNLTGSILEINNASIIDAGGTDSTNAIHTITSGNSTYHIYSEETDGGGVVFSVGDDGTTFSTVGFDAGADDDAGYVNVHSGGTLTVYDTSNDRSFAVAVADGADTTISTSAGDLVIDAAGGGVKVGTGTAGTIDLAGDDLYVTADLEVGGTIYGTVNSAGISTSLDDAYDNSGTDPSVTIDTGTGVSGLTFQLTGKDFVVDGLDSTDVFTLQSESNNDNATLYIKDTVTANQADLVITPSDGGILIDTPGATELASVTTTDARESLAITTDPSQVGGGAAADADGVIKLGVQEGEWEYIRYDASLGSKGKFVLSAPLQVIGSSAASIEFIDPDDTGSTTRRVLEFDYDGGTDGTGAFIFGDQAVIPSASPAYLNFGMDYNADTGTYDSYYAMKVDPDPDNNASTDVQSFSVVSIPNPGANWQDSEKTLFDICSDGSFNIYDPGIGEAVFQIEPGGILSHDFRNLIKNASFEAFSGFEDFIGYDPTYSETGVYNNTTDGYRGGWNNFAPDGWLWVEGKIVQHAPELFTTGGTAGTFSTDFYDGKSAVSINENTAKRGSNYVIGTPEDGTNNYDACMKQTIKGLEPNTWHSVGAAMMTTNATTTKAILDITGDVTHSSTEQPKLNLTAVINSGDTLDGSATSTISTSDTSSFPKGGTVLIDNELFDYIGKTTTSLTGVTREINSTTAATHTTGTDNVKLLFKPIVSTSTTFEYKKRAFKTDSSGSNVIVYLICQQTGAAGDTDFARFDAVQMVEGKVLPKYGPTSIVDIGDQAIYGTLKLGRAADGRGGILSVDQFIRTRGIDFFDDDPGMSGSTGGGGCIDQPWSMENFYSGTTYRASGLVFANTSGYYVEPVIRKFHVRVQDAGSGTDEYKYNNPIAYVKYRYQDCMDPMNEWLDTAWGYNGVAQDWSPWSSNIAISTTAQTLNYGINISFSDTTGYKGGDQWQFKAWGMSPEQQMYDSYDKDATYRASEARIFKDPATGELTFEDSKAGKVRLSEIISQASGGYVSPPVRDPYNSGTLNITASGSLATGVFSSEQYFEIGIEYTDISKYWWHIRQDYTGGTTWYGNWNQSFTQGVAVDLISDPDGVPSSGDEVDTGIDVTFPSGTYFTDERWTFYATPGSASNVASHGHANANDGGLLAALGTTAASFKIANNSTIGQDVTLNFYDGNDMVDRSIKWNDTMNRFDVSNDVNISGSLTATSLSGATSTSGTSNATFTVDSDSTGSTEPVTGTGFVIEGGSGDVGITYNATNDYLDITGQTGVTDTFTGINIPSGTKYKIGGTDLAASDVGAAATGHTHSNYLLNNTDDVMAGGLTIQTTAPSDLVIDNSTTGVDADSGYITLRGNEYTGADTEIDMSVFLDIDTITDYKLSFKDTGRTNEVASLDESGNLQIDGDGIISGGAITLGNATNQAGSIVLYDGDPSLGETITISTPGITDAGSWTMTLPNAIAGSESFLKMGTDGIIDYDTSTYLTTEVDGSVSNEINTITGDDTNTTSGLAVTLAGGTGITTSVSGDIVTLTNDLGTSIESTEITDGTIAAGDIAGAAITKAKLSELAPSADGTTKTVSIAAGDVYVSGNTLKIKSTDTANFASGNCAYTPTTASRYIKGVIVMNSEGTLSFVTTGSSEVDVRATAEGHTLTYPADKMPIAEVILYTTNTGVGDVENIYALADAGDAKSYIYKDVRPFLNLGGGSSDLFKTISVSGQSAVVADSSTDTLTFAAGDNVIITTDATTDTVTIAASGGTIHTQNTDTGTSGDSFTIGDGSTNVNINAGSGTFQLSSSGIDIDTSGNITNAGNYTGIGAVTVSAGGTNQNVTLTPSGTGYTVLNGSIGIGTTAPTALLELDGASATSGAENLSTTGESTAVTTTNNAFSNVQVGAAIIANSLTRHVTAKTDNNTVTVDSAVDWSTGYAFTYKNSLLELADDGTSRLMVRADGNVGIGTTDPSEALHVVGNITATGTISGASITGGGSNALITFRLMGVLIPLTDIDGPVYIPADGTIQSISVYRDTAGSSSSTIVDININGTTIFTTQANRPTMAFDDADKKITVTNMDITALSAGDILSCDVDQVEAVNPEDIIVTVEIQ